jgi:hypothetical protein
MPVRGMLVVLMLLGLVLSASIPEAFGDKGLLFAGAYVAMQVGRSLFMVYALKQASTVQLREFHPHQHLADRVRRLLDCRRVAGARGPADRLADRAGDRICRTGFGFFVPGSGARPRPTGTFPAPIWRSVARFSSSSALARQSWYPAAPFPSCRSRALTAVVFATGFVGTVTMWWLYFRFGHERAAHRIEHDETPGSMARQAFTYAHIPILAGIIVHAVAVEFMFSHPHETGRSRHHAQPCSAAPALFLIGNLWFKGATSGKPPLSHLAGLVLLILLAFVSTVHRGLPDGHSGNAGADRRRRLGIPLACRARRSPTRCTEVSPRRADPAAARPTIRSIEVAICHALIDRLRCESVRSIRSVWITMALLGDGAAFRG